MRARWLAFGSCISRLFAGDWERRRRRRGAAIEDCTLPPPASAATGQHCLEHAIKLSCTCGGGGGGDKRGKRREAACNLAGGRAGEITRAALVWQGIRPPSQHEAPASARLPALPRLLNAPPSASDPHLAEPFACLAPPRPFHRELVVRSFSAMPTPPTTTTLTAVIH